MSKKTVLIVEDDPKTARLISLYLTNDGYDVLSAADGNTGLRLARERDPILIVLDIMLPGMDGLALCRKLREESEAFIIMVTARSTEEDKLIGLETGADDYVVKPFSPRELSARVRAVLRRAPEEAFLRGMPKELSIGDLTINIERQEIRKAGEPIQLTAVEFKLLAVLMKAPGRVFSRAQLVEQIFGYNYEGFERSIDVHILKLRKKIEDSSEAPRYIQTVYGVGYRLKDAEE